MVSFPMQLVDLDQIVPAETRHEYYWRHRYRYLESILERHRERRHQDHSNSRLGSHASDFKRRRWREKHSQRPADYLNTHRFPVILGLHARHYLIDRHHLALALQDEGIWELPVLIVANMSTLSFDEFWKTLEVQNWSHPFDSEGRRRPYDDMPTSVDDLTDDPYRSLAGSLRRAGGYAKDKAPFSEFRWADFLRGRIPRELVERHFGRALALAMNLAQSKDAAVLPGWRRYPGEVSRIGQEASNYGARTFM
jgi:hypothetical protein